MIVVHDAIFGYVNMIIFQLTERIALITKSSKAVFVKVRSDMLAFAYSALPTRHEVPIKPIGLKENIYNKRNSKLKSLAYRRCGLCKLINMLNNFPICFFVNTAELFGCI